MTTEHFDILIVGAGLSGIGAAWHFQDKCPNKSFAILEARDSIGGTWDIHRYPGVRSDSEMYTYAYNFKPWTSTKVIAEGHEILEYIRTTAKENGIDKKIRFGMKVTKANWSDDTNMWTVTTTQTLNDEIREATFTCNFLLSCAGYYSYEGGYTPEFKGRKNFNGPVVHPQDWPEDLDYRGKNVVIIGSGATAVTLLPSMAKTAKHVTMLQRSPTYMANIPANDRFSDALRWVLPDMLVHRLGRARGVALQRGVFRLAQSAPKFTSALLRGMVKHQVGNNVDMKHFTPSYNPWDERLCAVPNGDLFKALRTGHASVVTQHIDQFTKNGILLENGEELAADIIVTATGFTIQLLGGMQLSVNNEPVKITEGMVYKGTLFENVPNAAMIFGYTNSSWTLKSDLSSEYICRLLNYMDKMGAVKAMPVNKKQDIAKQSFITNGAGCTNASYIQRALKNMPLQGDKLPWKVHMNYLKDLPMLRFSSVNDDAMEFSLTGQLEDTNETMVVVA